MLVAFSGTGLAGQGAGTAGAQVQPTALAQVRQQQNAGGEALAASPFAIPELGVVRASITAAQALACAGQAGRQTVLHGLTRHDAAVKTPELIEIASCSNPESKRFAGSAKRIQLGRSLINQQLGR
jgi:hypothetical protein